MSTEDLMTGLFTFLASHADSAGAWWVVIMVGVPVCLVWRSKKFRFLIELDNDKE
ncbi:MAG: hypothetical protein ACOH2I_15995 [Pseudomonas sp.]